MAVFLLIAVSTSIPKTNASAIPVAGPGPNSGTLWVGVELVDVLVEVVELVLVSVCDL